MTLWQLENLRIESLRWCTLMIIDAWNIPFIADSCGSSCRDTQQSESSLHGRDFAYMSRIGRLPTRMGTYQRYPDLYPTSFDTHSIHCAIQHFCTSLQASSGGAWIARLEFKSRNQCNSRNQSSPVQKHVHPLIFHSCAVHPWFHNLSHWKCWGWAWKLGLQELRG